MRRRSKIEKKIIYSDLCIFQIIWQDKQNVKNECVKARVEDNKYFIALITKINSDDTLISLNK